MGDADKPYRTGGAGLIVMLRLTPGASRDAVEGIEPVQGGVALRARVRAAPEKGKANVALGRLLGKWLGVAPSRVRLKSGGTSRLKSMEIEGDPAALAAAIETRLAANKQSGQV
ncbi:MAG: DUF167 family protein [Pseudomonadota bacterium]|nr:DUF167 family protein [Pseudomonadota bacterium]